MYKRILKWVAILVATFTLSLVFLFGGYVLWFKVTEPRGTCLSVPFSADKAGNEVTCEVKIARTNLYSINLVYDYFDTNDRNRIMRIIGGYDTYYDTYKEKFKHPGSPISLQVIVKDSAGKIVFDSVVNNPRSNGHMPQHNQLTSAIFDRELKRGKYIITIRNLKDAPSMGTILTHVEFNISNTRK